MYLFPPNCQLENALYPNWMRIRLVARLVYTKQQSVELRNKQSCTPWNDLYARNITIADDGRALFSTFVPRTVVVWAIA